MAACHGAGRCPPAARADRAIGGVATGLMTLVPAARDQRLRNRSAAALAWILLKGREPGGEPKENRNRAAAEGNEPENAGPRGTRDGGQRGRTRRANGKPEESPPRKPEDAR